MLAGIDPVAANAKLSTHGGFNEKDWLYWGVVGSVFPFYAESVIPCPNPDIPFDKIDAALLAGKAVIVQLDRSPSEGVQSHYVIITGKNGDKDYFIYDPWVIEHSETDSILSRYADGRSIAVMIEQVVIFSGVSSYIEHSELPVASGGDTVTVVSNHVNIRRLPTTSGNEPIGQALYGMDFVKAGPVLPGTGTVKGWQPVIVYIATGQADDGDYLE